MSDATGSARASADATMAAALPAISSIRRRAARSSSSRLEPVPASAPPARDDSAPPMTSDDVSELVLDASSWSRATHVWQSVMESARSDQCDPPAHSMSKPHPPNAGTSLESAHDRAERSPRSETSWTCGEMLESSRFRHCSTGRPSGSHVSWTRSHRNRPSSPRSCACARACRSCRARGWGEGWARTFRLNSDVSAMCTAQARTNRWAQSCTKAGWTPDRVRP